MVYSFPTPSIKGTTSDVLSCTPTTTATPRTIKIRQAREEDVNPIYVSSSM